MIVLTLDVEAVVSESEYDDDDEEEEEEEEEVSAFINSLPFLSFLLFILSMS